MRGFKYFDDPIKKIRRMFTMIIIFCTGIALIIMMTQWIWFPGHWFDLNQILHHEDFTLDLLFFSFGMAISWLIVKDAIKKSA